MITVKQQEKLIDKIKGLTELEFTTLFEELGDHIQSEGWHHVIKKYYDAEDYDNQIEDLNDTIEELEDENKKLGDENFSLTMENLFLKEELEKVKQA